MSDNHLFGEENSPTRVLWRAILRYDDDEVAENLFSLVGNQRMSQAEEAIVAKIFKILKRNHFRRLSNIVVPFESFIEELVRESIAIAEATNTGTAETSSRSQSGFGERARRTWAECRFEQPGLLLALRMRRLFGESGEAPNDFHIAQAISRTLDAATAGEQPSWALGLRLPALSRTDLWTFLELRKMYPDRVELADIPQWVAQLSSKDWRLRFTARLVVQSVGLAAHSPLMNSPPTKAKEAMWHNIWSDSKQCDVGDPSWYCLHCRSRFGRCFFPGREGSHSQCFACRSCANTRFALRITQVVCVLDSALAKDPRGYVVTENGKGRRVVDSQSVMHSTILAHAGDAGKMPVFPMLLEPWSSTRRPFDFELLYIGVVDDMEIEQLLAALLSDNETECRRYMSAITAAVAHPERLSTNSKNALSRLFHKVVYSPTNLPEMATIAAFIEHKRKRRHAGHARQTA